MSATPISFTFDWCPGEHARVTSLLIHEQFSSGLWRILKWAVVFVLAVSAALTIAAAAVGARHTSFPSAWLDPQLIRLVSPTGSGLGCRRP